MVAYGVSDNFSVSVGTIIPVTNGLNFYFFAQKYAFNTNKKVKFSLSNLLFLYNYSSYEVNPPYSSYTQKINKLATSGIFSANITFGDSEKNLTLSFGKPYTFSTNFQNGFIFTASGMSRIHNRIMLISENSVTISTYNTTDLSFLLIEGLRFLGKNGSFDLGITSIFESYNLYPYYIPYIGFQKFLSKHKSKPILP